MLFKKSVSLFLVATQIGIGTSIAFADNVPPPINESSEFTLVENALALQGQNMSPALLQSRMSSLVTQYIEAAPADGAPQRLQQALVQLGVYSPAQAQAYVSDAQKASLEVASTESGPAYLTSMANQIEELAATHPAGAQFSGADVGCYGSDIGAALLVIGATAAGVGDFYRTYNPTCTTPTASGIGTIDGHTGIVTIVTGPTTCTNPNYYPDAKSGQNIESTGYVMLAVGGILLAVGYFNGFFDACMGY